MTFQKTYKRKSANQILKSADVTLMASGDYEITSPNMPGCIFAEDQDGDLIISNFDGIVVGLTCTPMAQKKLAGLSVLANQKTIERLKREDEVNGTTYAEHL